MTNNVSDERLRAAAAQFRDTWMRAGAVRVNDSRSSEITMLVDFARLREDSAMREAAGWIRASCQVDTGDGIYGDADRYTEEEIIRAIHERLALKGKE